MTYDALIKHLKSTGKVKLLPKILRELKTREARTKVLAPRIEVAKKSEEAAALRAAHEIGIDVKHAVVNEKLVSGWRAFGNGVLVDRSGKRALIDIYRNVTQN